MTKDIDWQAVDMVCDGYALRLRRDEIKAVIRRLDDKMIGNGEWQYIPPGMLTSKQVAERLHTTDRSVVRWRRELPPASKSRCAICGEPMWVRHDGYIEPHADKLFHTCDGMPQAEIA